MRYIEVGGSSMPCHTTTGDPRLPLVVLLHGSGSPVSSWDEVRARVDGHVTTVAYDRASRLGRRGPVTAQELAADLGALLHAGGWKPPYLLVGHSYGGVVARTFAQLVPQDVAGVVLVDATHEALASLGSARFRLALRAADLVARLPMNGGRALAAAQEVAGIGASLRQLRPLMLPTWCLTGGHASTGWQHVVREDFAATYGRLAASNPLVRHRVVPTAGHDLPTEAPAAVVATIKEALATAREGAVL